MQNVGNRTYGGVAQQVSTLGRALRLMFEAFSPRCLKSMERSTFAHYFTVMGPRSLPLITLGAIAVGMVMTTQVVLEAQRFNAEDLTGAAIAVGLLREIGPLTVGLAWAARIAAFLTETAFVERVRTEQDFSGEFLAPAYLAAIAAALPLAAYGLVIGFGACALLAPMLGVSSSADFLESARQAIQDRDVVVYLLKLTIIFPTMVIFATCLACLVDVSERSSATSSAITYVCILCFVFNLICTWAWYVP